MSYIVVTFVANCRDIFFAVPFPPSPFGSGGYLLKIALKDSWDKVERRFSSRPFGLQAQEDQDLFSAQEWGGTRLW